MGTSEERTFRRLAVVGAGNMGSGIAQKMAAEGFEVVLLDVDSDKAQRGVDLVRRTLDEGVERKILRADKAREILGRLHPTSDWGDLADVDLVVEAVFEDPAIKAEVFRRLDEVTRADAILATNTSSLLVTRLAETTRHPGRVIGLHYFYHPAKNRLVEVVAGHRSDPAVVRAAWSLQEQIGKTPIHSADAPGFVVNRYFVPWLNEAVRLLEQGVADVATIEGACRTTFGIGMGPFQLMNLTGVPIALHAATTLGREFGPFYAPAERLRQQVESAQAWTIEGTADPAKSEVVADRMCAVVFHVASTLVDEGVGTIEDTDIGARVGLRWPRGPFEMMNRIGVERAGGMVRDLVRRLDLPEPALLTRQVAASRPFPFRFVQTAIEGGVATLTLNRPDAMNALNEAVVEQLREAFAAVTDDPRVRGIVLAGAGKAFVAGADIRFFLRHIESGNLDRIVEFTRAGHALLEAIDGSRKPVVARIQGLTLGGGVELALACDFLVASPKAGLALPETGIGIYPGLGGTQRLPRRVGNGLAKWLIFTGKMLSAEQAHEVGLVDEVVPHGELDRTARRLIESGVPRSGRTSPPAFADLAAFFDSHSAEDIRLGKVDAVLPDRVQEAVRQVASKAPLALRLAERLIDEGSRGTLKEGLQMELDHLVEIFGTEDARTGLSSVGRNKPLFEGR